MEFKAKELIAVLEEEELETMFLENPEKYIHLFAAYLHENDLSSANFLWKRIPKNVKVDNKTLERLHNIYIAMWNNNSNDVFKLLNYTWPTNLVTIMMSLEEKKTNEIFDLIGNSYTSISTNNLELLTNMSSEKIKSKCKTLNWNMEINDNTTLVYPKLTKNPEPPSILSEDQLFALTEFVSFLEN